jgi:C-5 cytosine-specific DNA methylase
MRATVAEVSRPRGASSHFDLDQARASHVQARTSHVIVQRLEKLEAVDLFCGFGGVTEGLKRAGLEVALAVDFDAQAIRAHRAEHPEVPVFCRDVSQVRPSELAGRFVWASPSCRPYSMANTTGPRGKNHPEYFPLTKLLHMALGARVLVIENVPGLMWSREGRQEILELEEEAARFRISFQWFSLRASDFGLPQRRERFFFVMGAGLILNRHPNTGQKLIGPTVTTRSSGDVSHLAAMQGLTNPETLRVPDWRSGRRSSRSHVPVAGPSTARRLIWNAIPPEMAEGVARLVLEGLR